jgi:transitional endoplasmic reticulum ATPase
MATAEKAPAEKAPATTVQNVDVAWQGSQIVLPVGKDGKRMAYDEAIEWMRRKRDEAEKEVAVLHEFACSPLDGAVAFHKALGRKYGWIDLVPTGWFGEKPPLMVSVPTSVTDHVQVPWGRLQVPGIEGFLQTGLEVEPTPRFTLNGKVKQKHMAEIQELTALTAEILKNESIYKHQAIKVNFKWRRDQEAFNPLTDCPKFFGIAGVSEDDLILPSGVRQALDIGLFTPIQYAAACRRNQVPLKRGVLLYGPYGTGKSLTASITAIKAVRHGFTFCYLETVEDLAEGLKFAAAYAPAVLFCEDIDRALSGDRDVDMDEVLNILDGVDTKGKEIITVFTTNHVEKINPAILRMGRLDTIVEVAPPDAEAAERLVRLYARGLLDPACTLEKAGRRLAGKIPALIREATERAKLVAIDRELGGNIRGKVQEADIIAAADAMEPHVRMLTPAKAAGSRKARLLVEVPADGRSVSDVLTAVGSENGNGEE